MSNKSRKVYPDLLKLNFEDIIQGNNMYTKESDVTELYDLYELDELIQALNRNIKQDRIDHLKIYYYLGKKLAQTSHIDYQIKKTALRIYETFEFSNNSIFRIECTQNLTNLFFKNLSNNEYKDFITLISKNKEF